MNDTTLLELHELAAHAIGLKIWWQDDRCFSAAKRPDPTGVITGMEWNPLKYGDDSQRLQVELKLHVLIYKDQTNVEFLSKHNAGVCFQLHGTDPLAATRLAILRAAAEIGRAMVGHKG